MKYLNKEMAYQLRYALPLWLIGLLTDWWPSNRITDRIRGWLASWFVKKCGKNFLLSPYVSMRDAHMLEIGDNVYLGRYVWIGAHGGLVIEDEVNIGPFVVISTLTHCFKNGSVHGGGLRAAPIRIGKGSWLAAHVVVSAGVTVGKGVLAAANAVITKDTPDHVMVGGVPAKVIGPLEEQESTVTSRWE